MTTLLCSRRISSEPSLLGESPVWDGQRNRIYWVDGVSCLIHALDHATGAHMKWQTPSMVGSIGLAGPDRLVAGLADGIYTVDLVSGACAPVYIPPVADPQARFNDGKVDPRGRFVCGTMGIKADGRGALYRVGADGGGQVLATGIRISNALCFSPDGRTLYFADSMDRMIRGYDYMPDDMPLSRPRMVIDTRPFDSGPDGATVDCEGYLWVALIQAARIARFAPDGQLDRLVEAPTDLPTCLAFGGPDLATLYVTSIKDSGSGRAVSRHPAGGHLFAIEGLGVTGLPEPHFGHAAL